MNRAWQLMRPHWVYYGLCVVTIGLWCLKSPWAIVITLTHVMLWVGFYEKGRGH